MSNPYPLDGYDYYQMIEYAACDQETYQQDIVVHRTTGTAYEETVGPLRIWHIYVGDHCREDYGDVRFTNSAGAELAYYLWPDYSSESARFTVRLEGADQSGALTVWYGNPSATTTSDGDATFPHFDQFDGTSLDLTKWTLTPRAIATVANGQLSLKGTYGGGLDGICGKILFDTSQYQVQWGVVSGQPTAYAHWGWGAGASQEAATDDISFRWAPHNGKQVGLMRAGVWNPVDYDWPSTPGEYRVARSGSTALFMSSAGVHSINDAEKVTTVDLAPRAAISLSGTSAIVLDYCVVRAYSATPPAAITFSGEPAAAFAATPHVGPAPLTVQFTDQSTGAPTSWLWDFGDGYSSTEQHPIHIYETPGIYTVTLTVRNEHGAYRGIREGYITVGRPPATRYALSVYEVKTGRLPGWANEPILLTIPAGSVTGVLEDFPVMVKLSGSSGANHADVSKVFTALGSDANRKRICVTAGDGLTPCYVEIKEWSTATQTAYLWVRVPRIDPGLDTHLYLYYDPLHAEMTEYVGDTASETAWNVWDNGYGFVGLKPSGGQLLDSTRNQNHGTVYGATEVDGPLGRCLSFDGVDDCASIPHSDVLNLSTGGSVTAVFRTSLEGAWYRSIVSKYGDVTTIPYWGLGWGAANNICVVVRNSAGTVIHVPPASPWGNNGEWHQLDGTIDPAGKTTAYRDGAFTGQANTPVPYGNTSPVQIARHLTEAASCEVAFVAVSSSIRSPAWIAATNLSLRDELIVYSDPDAPLTLAAYVDAYEYLSWTRRYRRPGAWKCQINRYLPAAKEFVPGRLVHFKRNGEDRLALIETRQISVDTSGRPSEQWTVAGREVLGILGDRLCLHGVSTGTGYDVQTGPAETVMRHYVDANAINPADYTRIVPFLSFAPVDGGRGGTTKQSARFDVLTDLLESICAASGLGYRGRWSWDDRRLYFEVIEGVDRSDSVKLSPALGNCTIKGYNESTNLAPSVAVVAGQGEAAVRMVVDVGKEAGLCGLARRERFVDARDLTTEADLRQRGAEKLAEDGDTTTLEIEYIQTAMYRYGEDFDLGDIVHVEYPDIAAMDARIVEIVEEYAREGERLTLVLGTEWPDLTGVLRLAQKDNVVKRV